MNAPIDQLRAVAPAGPAAQQTSAPSARESSPAFRALLDSLERLAQPAAATEPVEDAESLKRAIAEADTGFQQAMDLRRALEDAFKTRLA
jgi:hypothetical protein